MHSYPLVDLFDLFGLRQQEYGTGFSQSHSLYGDNQMNQFYAMQNAVNNPSAQRQLMNAQQNAYPNMLANSQRAAFHVSPSVGSHRCAYCGGVSEKTRCVNCGAPR